MSKPTHNATQAKQDDIVIGNLENKAELSNPLARWMVGNFDRTLFKLVEASAPKSIHEVGCGEGRLTEKLATRYEVPVRGTDFSREIIAALQAEQSTQSRIQYLERSIYDLHPSEDHADLVICCEVLEHLEDPIAALKQLHRLGARHYIFSVPREPIWRVLNVLRGKYWSALGNTPGHLQHWSANGFLAMLEHEGFAVVDRRRPFPWTMLRAEPDRKR